MTATVAAVLLSYRPGGSVMGRPVSNPYPSTVLRTGVAGASGKRKSTGLKTRATTKGEDGLRPGTPPSSTTPGCAPVRVALVFCDGLGRGAHPLAGTEGPKVPCVRGGDWGTVPNGFRPFRRASLRWISGQNSLKMLLRLAASNCVAQLTAVLCGQHSPGGGHKVISPSLHAIILGNLERLKAQAGIGPGNDQCGINAYGRGGKNRHSRGA